jgi:flagellar basal-body rod modification protein FlgD
MAISRLQRNAELQGRMNPDAAQVGQSGTVSGGSIGSGNGAPESTAKTGDATAPKFGEVLTNIQNLYGARPEKPREVKKALGKDDFLRIMISQMKNQDPTNPFKAEQMASEMAQFASVEQLQNINSNIGKLAVQNQPAERMALTNLIGKTITVDRERFAHVENSPDSIGFNLPKDASKLKVMILSDTGETVLERDLGARKKGEGSFAWDGLKSNSLPARTGNYFLKLDARDEHDVRIGIQTQGKARVMGVSFEGTEALVLVGDRKNQQKISMKSVVKIETDEPGQETPKEAQPEAIALSAKESQVSSPLKKPEIPMSDMGLGDRLNQVARKTPQVPPAPQVPQDQEKGFPNGLTQKD